MHFLLVSALVLIVPGLGWAADWTILAPGDKPGYGNVVRQKGSLEEANKGAKEAAKAAKEANEVEIPLAPAYSKGEKDWTVLKPDGPDGRSKVLRERAPIEEAKAVTTTEVSPEGLQIQPGGGEIDFPELGPAPKPSDADAAPVRPPVRIIRGPIETGNQNTGTPTEAQPRNGPSQ